MAIEAQAHSLDLTNLRRSCLIMVDLWMSAKRHKGKRSPTVNDGLPKA